MAALNLRRRQALRYADAQNTARHDMRAAEGEFRATVTRHPSALVESSTPTLQRIVDRAFPFLGFIALCAVVGLTACGAIGPEHVKRDPVPTCIEGRQVVQVGEWGPEKVPVVAATYRKCKRSTK